MEECRLLYLGYMRWGMVPLRHNTQPRLRLMTGKVNSSDATLAAVSATLLGPVLGRAPLGAIRPEEALYL
jgi:hypothetical protein